MQAEKEPGRDRKLKQYRRHMNGLRFVIKALCNLTIDEAGDENITVDLIGRKDRFEQAAVIIRRDLGIRARVRIKS